MSTAARQGGGGGDGGGGDGGGCGGAEGGAHRPSQSIMYSTCTTLPSNGNSSTALVAVVTIVYMPSSLGRIGRYLAHSKKLSPTSGARMSPRAALRGRLAFALPTGLHFPCSSSPLTVVPTTYSSISSKSVFLTRTVR